MSDDIGPLEFRGDWIVVLRPIGGQAEKLAGKDENKGGLLVIITDGDRSIEVTRVAFVRRASKNPDTPFEEQLGIEIKKAEEACEVINESLDKVDRQQEEARRKARKQLRDLLGPLGGAKLV